MNFKYLFILLFLCLCSFGCEEINNPIPSFQPNGARKVLLEEFSGANCAPCADAAQEIANLQSLYGENLVVVTMHTFLSSPQARPVADATYDFRTLEGTEILGFLGVPIGIPTGSVNRALFENEDDLLLNKTQWAGFIAQEISRAPEVGLTIEHSLEATSRVVNIMVRVVPNQDLSGDFRLSVLLTEDNITDKQLSPNGVIDDFKHSHILRSTVTPFDGLSIGNELFTGKAITRSFRVSIPTANDGGPWDIGQLNIVAFATINDIDKGIRRVLQADEVSIE
ncbi:MAG: Omp28-related outer membrane protein [Saprospiraceae bacterium]